MKVGILTFSNAMNYGAVLQALALQKQIESMETNCEIIDYQCDKFKKIYSVFYRSNKGVKGLISMILYLPLRIVKYNRFNRFRKTELRYSEKRYDSTNREDIKGKYDIIIVGSDQVWNPIQTDSDMTYFLDFIDENTVCASYAASLGISELTQETKNIFECELKKFKFISVREQDSTHLIQPYAKTEVKSVCDPVFFLNRNEWIRVLKLKPINNKKYIFTYCLHERSMYDYSKKLSDKYKYKNIVMPDSLFSKVSGHRKYTTGVRELVNYVFNAECVVTDSFHVLALSLILHKNVRVMLKEEYRELNGRLVELVKKFSLSEIIINKKIEDLNIIDINYENIDRKIKKEVNESVEYINNIINYKGE